jgi:hypothetical protein
MTITGFLFISLGVFLVYLAVTGKAQQFFVLLTGALHNA